MKSEILLGIFENIRINLLSRFFQFFQMCLSASKQEEQLRSERLQHLTNESTYVLLYFRAQLLKPQDIYYNHPARMVFSRFCLGSVKNQFWDTFQKYFAKNHVFYCKKDFILLPKMGLNSIFGEKLMEL